jgi:protein-S-isoprenylcysteine O-methyltransferase Ste14
VILIGSIVASYVLGIFTPLPWVPSPIKELLDVFGVLLIGIALCIEISAMLEMRKAKTTILPHKGSSKLVTSGPFSFTRNPIYFGNVILLFGAGLLVENIWFWLFALACGALTQRLAILREEAHLQAKFPAAFLAYKKKVRRWI